MIDPLTPTLHLLRAASLIEERLSGPLSAIHGLAMNEVLLLLHLANAPQNRLPRVELSRRLHVSASTVTRMAAPLEKIGLLAREADARDARLAFVVLTPTGQTRIAEVRTTLKDQAARLFQDRWEDSEITDLATLLGRLIAHAPGDLA